MDVAESITAEATTKKNRSETQICAKRVGWKPALFLLYINFTFPCFLILQEIDKINIVTEKKREPTETRTSVPSFEKFHPR